MHRARLIGVLLCFVAASCVTAQEKFSQTVGAVRPQAVQNKQPIEIPFITWGGDAATFHANGGLTTQNGTIYDDLGLKIRLTPGDDFVGQVKNYMSGKTPFLRGTFRMLGQASEVLGSSPGTKPVVIMQLSWSAGDHIVSRKTLNSLNDLAPKNGRKVRIAIQKGGPHVGLLFDSLASAKLTNRDVELVWVDDLTGANGPAQKFRDDQTIDACCVITPDMLGLTGGFDSKGTGAEGTVEGAQVLNSTQSMSRSIADVYAVRSDWYKANRDFVEKFVAGYLKSTAEVVQMRNSFESSGNMNSDYRKLLTTSQNIFGKEVLPTLEVDAHGLLLDCNFVGLPGQVAFFDKTTNNLSGFYTMMESSLNLATNWGYASSRMGFDPPTFDYAKMARTAGMKYEAPTRSQGKFQEAEVFEIIEGEGLDENTIVSFTINFDVNQNQFAAAQFGPEFKRALQAASTFGNAVVVIRGHADPTKALGEFVRAGLAKKTIRVTGNKGNRRYYLRNGAKLDLTQTDTVVRLINSGQFETAQHRPQQTMQAALNLSKARADAVKKTIVDYAKSLNVPLDATQIQPVGAGISDPIVPRPINNEQAAENRRVEFRIVRVPAEALSADDFDF